ncbi:mitochondrial carrier [Microstroma glucosiphilum]|uniref:Mitochondrial carrier n=1 Tax=Pseudomicrostroma glucosiphilum TaxID=1684307 RepID=A0A316U209_9BASI|nr:mitochondrial carrier [Pseudomicrostroma glucosiphilum]PWN18463.1 mitochondrial carrier [Pseudomicrostroma glucosiphilum]
MAEPLTPFGDALAGALGAVYASTLTYPMDTVKTRIQAGTVWKDHVVRKDGPDGKSVTVRKNVGLLDGMLVIARSREGISGLYKGLGANIVNAFSMQFAYFYWYSFIRNFYLARLMKRNGATKAPVIGTAMELALGALAGAVAQLFTIPVAVIATRQQLSSKAPPTGSVSSDEGKGYGKTTISGRPAGAERDEKKDLTAPLKVAASAVSSKLGEDDSFVGVAREILREDGVTGLWRGLRPSLVLTVNPAITYGVFERVKSLLLAASPEGTKLTPWRSFLVGALSKTLATVVTFPYILSKIRLQAKNTPYKGAIDVLRKIAAEKGITGWYQGMQAQIIKAVITQAVLFVARDYFTGVVRAMMNRRNLAQVLPQAAAAVVVGPTK